MKTFRLEAAPLLLALGANAAAQSFLLVVLPSLGRDLGFSTLTTGLLLGTGAMFIVVCAPFWGRATETRGRRPVLLVGFAGAAIGPTAMACIIGLRLDGTLDLYPAIALLLFARTAQAGLSAGLLPAAQAWMVDATGADNRTEGMGLLGASYGLGGVAGAAIAFRAGGEAPVAALFSLTVVTTVGAAAVWRYLPERRGPTNTIAPASSLRTVIGRIWPSLGVTFLGVSVFGILQHVTALRLEDSFSLPRPDAVTTAGGAMMGAAAAMAIVQLVGLRFLKAPPLRLALWGAVVSGFAMIGVASATAVPVLVVALVIAGLGLGILLPSNLATLSLAIGRSAQGSAAGINAVAQGLGLAAGPILGSLLHRLSPIAPSLAAITAMALVVTALLQARRAYRL